MIRAAACGFVLLLLAASGLAAFVYAAPEAAVKATEDVQRWRAGLARKAIQLEDIETVYHDGGAGEPLVLLHGFGGSKGSFSRVAARLTPHYRLVVPDLPGFGESEKSTAINYTLDAHVERLHAFTRALDLQRFALGGNSMGGLIAAAYALRHPEEVSSLWLLAGAPVEGAPDSELAILLQSRQQALAPGSPEEFKTLLGYAVAKPMRLPEPFLRVLAERALANRSLHDRIAREIRSGPSLHARMPELTMPVLIVWGEQDRVSHPATAGILHRMLPNSTLRLMPGIGHLPMVENPDQSASDYLAFRASLKK